MDVKFNFIIFLQEQPRKRKRGEGEGGGRTRDPTARISPKTRKETHLSWMEATAFLGLPVASPKLLRDVWSLLHKSRERISENLLWTFAYTLRVLIKSLILLYSRT